MRIIMQIVADLDLCKELYRLSLWSKNQFRYDNFVDNEWHLCETIAHWPVAGHEFDNIIPAYDTGYLLRKLPPVIQDPYDKIFKYFQMWINGNSEVNCGYVEPYAHDDKVSYYQQAYKVENALCKLSIELFKSEVLKN